MWLNRAELDSFQSLCDLGLVPSFEIGTRVGRGFADVGYEEYCVLPGNRLQSLLTGTIAPLVDSDKGKLFAILSPDEILAQIVMRGFDVLSLSCPKQRDWVLEMQDSDQNRTTIVGRSVLNATLAALTNILEKNAQS